MIIDDFRNGLRFSMGIHLTFEDVNELFLFVINLYDLIVNKLGESVEFREVQTNYLSVLGDAQIEGNLIVQKINNIPIDQLGGGEGLTLEQLEKLNNAAQTGQDVMFNNLGAVDVNFQGDAYVDGDIKSNNRIFDYSGQVYSPANPPPGGAFPFKKYSSGLGEAILSVNDIVNNWMPTGWTGTKKIIIKIWGINPQSTRIDFLFSDASTVRIQVPLSVGERSFTITRATSGAAVMPVVMDLGQTVNVNQNDYWKIYLLNNSMIWELWEDLT